MDVFDEELLHFWKSLNKCRVKYIMVGGVATNLHGYQRTTEDIDIWIKDDLENRKSLRSAFNEYGLGDLEQLEGMQFITGWTYFHLNNGMRLDVITDLRGLEQNRFDECRELSSVAVTFDVEVPFLHINHLIQAKKATDRPKDKIDVAMLQKINEIQNGQH